MVKAVAELKKNSLIFPNVQHVTCLAHALSLVAEQIRLKYALVNKYLADSKAFLLKSNKRKYDFKLRTGLPLPPVPVITRWGTWLDAADYHLRNFSLIKEFILTYKPSSKSAAFESLQKIIAGSKLSDDLFELRKYTPISAHIKALEKQGLSMEQQLAIVSEVESIIRGTPYAETLQQSLEKNPDLRTFTKAEAPDVRLRREFCPLVSVDVERSFSKFKSFLRPNRQRFSVDHITQHMVAYYNNFL